MTYEFGGVSGINDIELLPGGRGWGVGSMIAEWDGRQWKRHAASLLLNAPYTHPEACRFGHVLQAVSFFGEDFGVAVGDEGYVIAYERGAWHQKPSFTDKGLRDVVLLSPAEGWAVGPGIWRYSHGVWVETDTPDLPNGGVELDAVTFQHASAGWAVGDGVVLRYDGSTWSVVGDRDSSPLFDALLLDVAVAPSGHVWAVGLQGDRFLFGAAGAIIRFDGREWRRFDSPIDAWLLTIEFEPSGAGWIGARAFSDTDPPALVRWDGQAWTVAGIACLNEGIPCPYYDPTDGTGHSSNLAVRPFTEPSRDVRTIAFAGDAGWAASGSMLIEWKEQPTLVTGLFHNVLDVSAAGPTDIWAVGERGLMVRGTAAGWERAVSPAATVLYAVDMLTPDSGWAVGPGQVLRYDTSGWQTVSAPSYVFYDVAMQSASEGWFVGRPFGPLGSRPGVIIRWSDSNWDVAYRDSETEAETELFAVDFSDLYHGWAVGNSGTIVAHRNGQWVRVNSPTDAPLYLVSAVSENVAWAAGQQTLLSWDGDSWQREEYPEFLMAEQKSVAGMAFRSSTDGWLVAGDAYDGRLLAHYDGTSWEPVARLPCQEGITRVVFDHDQPFFLWLTDEHAGVYRWRLPSLPDQQIWMTHLPFLDSQ